MIVNFIAREINRGTRKLFRTPTLLKKKKKSIYTVASSATASSGQEGSDIVACYGQIATSWIKLYRKAHCWIRHGITNYRLVRNDFFPLILRYKMMDYQHRFNSNKVCSRADAQACSKRNIGVWRECFR